MRLNKVAILDALQTFHPRNKSLLVLTTRPIQNNTMMIEVIFIKNILTTPSRSSKKIVISKIIVNLHLLFVMPQNKVTLNTIRNILINPKVQQCTKKSQNYKLATKNKSLWSFRKFRKEYNQETDSPKYLAHQLYRINLV